MVFEDEKSMLPGFAHSRRAHCLGLMTAAFGLTFRDTAAQAPSPECREAHENSDNEMIQFLAARGPNLDLGSGAAVFARFEGSWNIDCVYFDEQGKALPSAGEWHFGWVLAGRAVQDVIYFYPAGCRPKDPDQLRGGTTVRVYDPKSGQWTITWNNASKGWAIKLRGGPVDDRIVLTGTDIDGSALRWTFYDISADRFLWRGEISKDDGATWRVEQTMTVTRASRVPTSKVAVLRPAWARTDTPGLELAEFRIGRDAVELTGNAVLVVDSTPMRLQYALTCTGSWEFLRGSVGIERAGEQRKLKIERRDGQWVCDGAARPDLAACRGIDLMGTPSTNSIPVRGLLWTPHESRTLRMAFVQLPDLAIRVDEQRYTRLPDSDEGAQRFHYQNTRTGFSADLEFDAAGLVVSYPPYWRRIYARDASNCADDSGPMPELTRRSSGSDPRALTAGCQPHPANLGR
jgi:uncharacterized protein